MIRFSKLQLECDTAISTWYVIEIQSTFSIRTRGCFAQNLGTMPGSNVKINKKIKKTKANQFQI